MVINDYINKSIVYGGNFAAGAIGKIFNYSIGNPYGAIAFGVLDILTTASKQVRSNVFTRWANVGGSAVFGLSTINDLVSVLNKDYSALGQLPFDASMAWQLGVNAHELSNRKGIRGNFRDLVKSIDNIFGVKELEKPKTKLKGSKA